MGYGIGMLWNWYVMELVCYKKENNFFVMWALNFNSLVNYHP